MKKFTGGGISSFTKNQKEESILLSGNKGLIGDNRTQEDGHKVKVKSNKLYSLISKISNK